jgi:tetratricopeptide (TPR) repeat protein
MFSWLESSTGNPRVKNCLTPLLLLALLTGPLAGFGQQPDSSFDLLIQAARQAQTAKDYATAVNAYRQAVRIQPNMAELWANLGVMEEETGDFADSLPSFQHANRLNPSLYVPNLFLGIDYVRAGKSKEAIPFLSKAEKSNATDPQPRISLGRAYTAVGKYSAAAEQFRRALSLDSNQSSTWFALGIDYLDQLEVDSRKMATEDKSSAYAKALFAESLAKQSRYVEATKAFQSAIDSTPQPPCLHSELGWSLLKEGNPKGAVSEFQKDESANPQCSLAVLGEAELSMSHGANQEALKLLNELWERDPGYLLSNMAILFDGFPPEHASSFTSLLAQQRETVPGGMYKALSAAISGSSEDSIRGAAKHDSSSVSATTSDLPERESAASYYAAGQFQRCSNRLQSSLASRQADNLLLLATCSFLTGDYERAVEASAALVTLSPNSAAALYWSVQANERLAFQSLARFEQLEPNSAKSHILLGDIYRQRRVLDASVDEYKRALEIAPNDPAAMLGLASAYLGNDDIDKAIETARAALPHSPEDPELNLLMAEALIAHRLFADAEPFLNKSLSAKQQMLPHVHALLGEVYADAGKTQDAIAQLKMGAESDEDGSLHYQLSRLYRQAGDSKSASEALQQMQTIRKQEHDRSAFTARDASPALTAEDAPKQD